MTLDEARDFIKNNYHAVMMNYRKDGSPQMTLVSVGLLDDGTPVVSSRETAYKVKNLRRDNRVSICIFTDGFFGKWIQIDGTAKVVSLPEALEPLVEYYQNTYGDHDDWDEYRSAMAAEQRVIIQVKMERAGPTVSG
jgi:PPOX class probable F420-dependent enzyme